MPRNKRSAGLLMFRRSPHPDKSSSDVEVFLVHPGGPFWGKKDQGAWTIPKGEYDDAEDPLAAARREFEEETGIRPGDEFIPLGEVRQAAGKLVSAWAFEGDCDPASIHSNSFSMEWPPRSGKMQQFPEVDRADWFTLEAAREKILKAQLEFLDRVSAKVG